MSNASDVLYEILQLQLSPWLDDTGSDEKYTAKLAGVKEKQPAIPLKYKIDFPRPFNNKTKYYVRLINNAVVDLISENITQIAAETDESIILFLLDELLDKNLKNRLRRVGELIKEMDYAPVYISNNFVPTPENSEHKTNTYIIQFLKLAYMQIYLEIQDEFKQYRGDILIAEDFYSQLLNEPVPNIIPLTPVLTVDAVETERTVVPPKKTNSDVVPGSLSYIDYDEGREKLNDAFDKLRSKGFIHKDVPVTVFRKVFSGREITKPIVWMGNRSELYYFIYLLITKHKLLANLEHNQWSIAQKCFVNECGDPFDMQKVRKLKRPELSYKELDIVVKDLI
ncbi:MAG: hypothetical protein L6264_05285 [Weeksellaceae bacterium]|nr:hypothetical protein [Bacteroidota bacterium]MCG2780343.1 hypothetical protein [Weeksellaceae bacterium]